MYKSTAAVSKRGRRRPYKSKQCKWRFDSSSKPREAQTPLPEVSVHPRESKWPFTLHSAGLQMCQGWSCDGEIFLQTLLQGTGGGNPGFSSARRLQGEAAAEEPCKKRTKRQYKHGDLASSSWLKDSTGVLTDSPPPDKQGLITAAMIPFC